MPRLSNSFLRHARSVHPLLLPLVRICRDIASARNELRWLKEHVQKLARSSDGLKRWPQWQKYELQRLCYQRGRGRPLQYILGSEFFGDLEIQCRPGVLIPRQETAASVSHLAQRLRRAIGSSSTEHPLRILDLCTGTGCISLLLRHELQRLPALQGSPQVPRILGIDISQTAVSLARANARRPLPPVARSTTTFECADVLATTTASSKPVPPPIKQLLNNLNQPHWDIVVSNPPYISPSSYRSSTTARSVRNFEPELALVPPRHGLDAGERADLFYPRVFRIARDAGAKAVLVEVADLEQAIRVVKLARESEGTEDRWEGFEIWRDEPGADGDGDVADSVDVDGCTLPIKGAGHARSVLCWRGVGGQWMGHGQRHHAS